MDHFFRQRLRVLAHALLAILPLLFTASAAAEGLLERALDTKFYSISNSITEDSASCDPCNECEEEEPICNYGPGDCCARGTLMQWSYGTSFSGGPDLDEPLVTDRPDFTEASSTVGRRVAQFEMGYTYTLDDDGVNRTISHSYPEVLLRYGVFAEWLELRFAWNFGNEGIGGPGAVQNSGSEDLYLGTKIALTPQEGFLPEMAIIPQMNVPTGSAAFTDGQVQPGLNWIYSWEINDCISTAGSSQINRRSDSVTGQSYSQFAQSWTVAYTLTERIGGYTEWFAFLPSSADTELPEHYFNGGFTFLLTNNIQFDFRGGLGLNDAADDYFFGSGLSIRLP